MFDLVSLGEILIDFTPSGTTEQGIPSLPKIPAAAPANVLAMNSKLGRQLCLLGKGRPGSLWGLSGTYPKMPRHRHFRSDSG